MHWQQLPPLPDKHGFAGSYAGVSNDVLLVAGGANFPDKKPWEGGTKVWYDTVFALDRPDGKWRIAGKLPRPLAYGVSVNYRGGVICAGGGDSKRYYGDVFSLEIQSGKLVTTRLPSLPIPLANACGALVGDTFYIAGGQQTLDAKESLKKMFALDLAGKEQKWRTLEAWPGSARILAAAAAGDGAFWLMGGAELIAVKNDKIERRYLKDAYRYDAGKGWSRIADLPHPIVAAPSPAPFVESGPLLLGGDDGSQVGSDPQRHRGFSRSLLRYDEKTERWSADGELPAPRVTAPVAQWNKMWVIVSGEERPGVRSPQIWALSTR